MREFGVLEFQRFEDAAFYSTQALASGFLRLARALGYKGAYYYERCLRKYDYHYDTLKNLGRSRHKHREVEIT
jgi:hypothetical protein